MMDYEGFKKVILDLTTIDLNSYKEKQMKRRIDSLIRKNGYDTYDEYVKVIKVNTILYSEFINYLTINVSEFYRNPEQWRVLESEIIPILIKKFKEVRVWSSACSTGDEPYTLVMVLNKFIPLNNIKILATDIDNGALEKAKAGIYSSKSLENLPEEFKRKFFTQSGDTYKVTDELKRCVEFRRHNLLRDAYPQDLNLIVCRNVLIYFTEEAKVDIYKKFNRSLVNEGILFVGSTEQIILANKYNLKPVRTFFYVKDGNI